MKMMDELSEVAPGELQPRKVAARQDGVAEFAGSREARLVADYDLLTEVMFESFQGPAWDKMAKRLVAYGLVVIKSWLRRGVIFNRCVEKGFGGIPNAQHGGITDEDDVMGLANETVWLAVLAYRDKVLIPGRWDPRKGANLTTYFIGQCLIQFPNVYKRWWRETQRDTYHTSESPLDQNEQRFGPTTTHVGTTREVIIRSRIQEGLEHADATDREILGWHAEGFTYNEIAELTEVKVGTIKSRIHRLRRRANTHDAA